MCGRTSILGALPWCLRPMRAPRRSACARRVVCRQALGRAGDRHNSFAEVTWARPKLKNGMGGSPRVMTDVIKPGDVIYVSPREPTDKEPDVTGQWSLEQVPQISGAMVAMDPHTGACSRSLAVLASPKASSIAPCRRAASQARPSSRSSTRPRSTTATRRRVSSSTARSASVRELVCRNGARRTMRLARRLPLDLALWHRAFAQPDDRPPVERHGHADHLRICAPLRRLRQSDADLSMALGAGETTLLRMVGAYGIIANGGKQIKPTLIDRIQIVTAAPSGSTTTASAPIARQENGQASKSRNSSTTASRSSIRCRLTNDSHHGRRR